MGLSDKNRFLSGLDGQDRTVFANLYDRAFRSEKFGGAVYGDFLSMDELSRFEQRKKYLPGEEPLLFGGYGGAERKVPGFNGEEDGFPIMPLEITGKGLEGLTHRDYLGALMGLGIDRHKIGDIIVGEKGAVVFAHSDVGEYIITSLSEVGRCTVHVSEADPYSLDLEPKKFEDIKGTVASLRLDSLVAMLSKKGRSHACELIKAGRVYVNGINVLRTDMKITDGDVITLRGFGKAVVEIGGLSKKERIFVTLKRYA
ncbi:MAG: RNA-binding protein [Clostridia bacterium]